MSALSAFRAQVYTCEECAAHNIHLNTNRQFCHDCGEILIHNHIQWATWYIAKSGALQGPFADWDEAELHLKGEDIMDPTHHMQPTHHPLTGEPMSMTKRELQPEDNQEVLREVAEHEDQCLAEKIQEAQALAWDRGVRQGFKVLGGESYLRGSGTLSEALKENPFRKDAPF